MKAFIVDRYKSNSALRLGEMSEPEVRDHDVLVAIHAASLNQLDAKIRDGEFKLILPYRLPLIPGNDVAGVVVRVGSKVRGFKSGGRSWRTHSARPDLAIVAEAGQPRGQDAIFADHTCRTYIAVDGTRSFDQFRCQPLLLRARRRMSANCPAMLRALEKTPGTCPRP